MSADAYFLAARARHEYQHLELLPKIPNYSVMTNAASGRMFTREGELITEGDPTMEEDAEALEKMFANILSVYPTGPLRAFWLSSLRRAALLTRCPHWPLGREQFLMNLCDPSSRSVGTQLLTGGQ